MVTGQTLDPRLSDPRPISYTPAHLAERIRAEQAALEARGATDGERKTITACLPISKARRLSQIGACPNNLQFYSFAMLSKSPARLRLRCPL
jgi:hypothetical protein